ncbi:hypothetical protein DMENIID0001_036220 [Sergentomyia squamirostris]
MQAEQGSIGDLQKYHSRYLKNRRHTLANVRPKRALASSTIRLQTSLSSAVNLKFIVHCRASLLTSLSHVILGLPTLLEPIKDPPLYNFLVTLLSSILCRCLAHLNRNAFKCLMMLGSANKLYISWLYRGSPRVFAVSHGAKDSSQNSSFEIGKPVLIDLCQCPCFTSIEDNWQDHCFVDQRAQVLETLHCFEIYFPHNHVLHYW